VDPANVGIAGQLNESCWGQVNVVGATAYALINDGDDNRVTLI